MGWDCGVVSSMVLRSENGSGSVILILIGLGLVIEWSSHSQ